jgi:hypothetical protein
MGAFSWGKVTTTNWGNNLGKVQQNPNRIDMDPDLAMSLGSFAQDLQHGYDNLKAMMRQAPWETADALGKGLSNGSIKNAIIHFFVKNTGKFARGSRFDKDEVIGTLGGEALQLGLPEGDVAKAGEISRLGEIVDQVAVHGNSLKSLKPTRGYKLYSQDGTFLKNGITSKLIPESRYTKAFMSDKFMEKVLFPFRQNAWDWEFLQNKIQRGPLNKNMH